MIQLNLLPDVKLDFLKAKRQKHLVSVVAFMTVLASVAALLLMFSYVQFAQKKHLNDLNNDIKKYTSQIKAKPDIEKVLTIQNQLKTLPSLLTGKPVVTRLFSYITQITPSKAGLSDLKVSFVDNTISIGGDVDNLETVNKFVDSLKFTTFKTPNNESDTPKAFSGVTLSTFSHDSTKTSYTINLTFNPTIFATNGPTSLAVPNIISTRSTTEQPAALFTGTTTGGN